MITRNEITNNPNFYDYIKNMTTLSTATLIVLITFTEKFAKVPIGEGLFRASIIFLLISILSAIMCMFITLSIQRYIEFEDVPQWEINFFTGTLLSLGISFILGVTFIGVFAMMNF